MKMSLLEASCPLLPIVRLVDARFATTGNLAAAVAAAELDSSVPSLSYLSAQEAPGSRPCTGSAERAWGRRAGAYLRRIRGLLPYAHDGAVDGRTTTCGGLHDNLA